jgi:hypothetical protein
MKSRQHLSFDFAAIILAVIVIFAVVNNCSDSEPPEKTGSPQKSHRWNTESKLRIVFRWPGDDFASKQDLETRDRIGRLLVENRLGKVVRTGTGMGWMDLVVELENNSGGRAEIEKIIKEISPEAKFSFEKLH